MDATHCTTCLKSSSSDHSISAICVGTALQILLWIELAWNRMGVEVIFSSPCSDTVLALFITMPCSQCLRAVEQDWFQFPISVQQTDWETGIAKAREQIQAHSQETPNFGGTTDIILVQQAKDIENAVKRLRDSMQVCSWSYTTLLALRLGRWWQCWSKVRWCRHVFGNMPLLLHWPYFGSQFAHGWAWVILVYSCM